MDNVEDLAATAESSTRKMVEDGRSADDMALYAEALHQM